jgi:hypothetical protein
MKYVASFQRVGAIYEETITLLSQFARERDWNVVKEKVFQENLLKKSSSAWIKDILGAVERRFFTGKGLLPNSRQISKFVSSNVSKSSKVQALYQYICNSDLLVDRLITGLVGPPRLKYGISKLSKEMYYKFLKEEAESHPELRLWSPSVYGKWQRSFFAFLRASGIMEKAPSFRIKKPVVRIEPFVFFVYGLLDKKSSGLEVIKSSLWRRYFMSEDDIEYALSSAQERGWLQYRRMGSIVELTPSYRSLEDWLNGTLG